MGNRMEAQVLDLLILVNEFLRVKASFPGGKLRIALIGKVEIIQTDLLDKPCPMKDMPNLFSKARD